MILVFLLILGLLVGSFVNVLIDRLPRAESVLWGRSHCDHCKKILRWYELVPVVSFLIQKGRCRRCRKKLSLQYPIIELVTAIGFALLFPHHFFYLFWALTRIRGIGFGDVKFAFLMGLLLGFPGVVIAFYVAFLTGALVGVILIVGRKKTWKSKIAFGPFLVLGTVVAGVWQQQLLTLWRMFL
ncbi:MAG: prepilin peptidase [Candidatus Gottesmanbacteria bacterium]|nr:prepilin peptidase [Candidatus Gottesmanbacteria bacterium]